MAGRMARAVARSLRSAPIRPVDDALVQLIKDYARLLDEAADPIRAYATLGPKLQAALRELAAAPAPGAGSVGEVSPGGDIPAVIVDLRARARARLDRAAGLHAAAS